MTKPTILARDPGTQQPSAVRCPDCGRRVDLDPTGDVECSGCGQPVNAFGQALRRGCGMECHCPSCAF
jgi:hypothetical protein